FDLGKTLTIEIFPMKGNKDVVGTKAKKAATHIIQQLDFHGFTIEKDFFGWDSNNKHCSFFIQIKDYTIDKKYLQRGPPLNRKQDCESFIKAHNEVFEQNGFLCTFRQRKFTDVKDAINAFIKDEYVTQ